MTKYSTITLSNIHGLELLMKVDTVNRPSCLSKLKKNLLGRNMINALPIATIKIGLLYTLAIEKPHKTNLLMILNLDKISENPGMTGRSNNFKEPI